MKTTVQTIATIIFIVLLNYPAQCMSNELGHLSTSAEYVFRGTVVAVDNRLSEPDSNSSRIPYTFVTYRVEKEFKGSSSEPGKMVLKFLGGAINSEEYMSASDFPLFDVGDIDILFVHNNTSDICPLVGCAKGRFRVIEGLIFNEFGESVLISPDGSIEIGPQVNLEAVVKHKVSETIGIERLESELLDSEYGASQLTELSEDVGYYADDSGFNVIVQDAVYKFNDPETQANVSLVKSADPDQKFNDEFFVIEGNPSMPDEYETHTYEPLSMEELYAAGALKIPDYELKSHKKQSVIGGVVGSEVGTVKVKNNESKSIKDISLTASRPEKSIKPTVNFQTIALIIISILLLAGIVLTRKYRFFFSPKLQ